MRKIVQVNKMVKVLWKDWRRLGFSLMRLGARMVKPIVKENQYWLLETVINDIELCLEKDVSLLQIKPNELENLARNQMNTHVWTWDSNYYYFRFEDFKAVKTKDLIDRIKWLADKFDCDNIASLFSSLMVVIFGCNSVGVALGAVIDKDTNRVMGYHAYNCLPLKVNDKVELYLFEPQTDYLAKAFKITDMDWARYRTDFVIWR